MERIREETQFTLSVDIVTMWRFLFWSIIPYLVLSLCLAKFFGVALPRNDNKICCFLKEGQLQNIVKLKHLLNTFCLTDFYCIAGYTPYTANLYWDKPVLCSVVARDAEGAPVYVKRYLEGYRLYVNGKLHTRLENSAQSITLTKCKPGKSYDVSLVALTSTEAARREKKRVSRTRPSFFYNRTVCWRLFSYVYD